MVAESPYLKKFFDYLNKLDVRYCIMNNYIDYPDVIPSDVDIVVEAGTFSQLDSLVGRFSLEAGLPVTQKIWHGHLKCAFILSPLRLRERFRLQLDFFVDFTAKGYYKLIESDHVLSTARKYKNFYVPDVNIEFVFLIMRRIIKNDMTDAKLAEIDQLMSTPGFSLALVEKVFGAGVRDICGQCSAWTADEFKDRIKESRIFLYDYSKSVTPYFDRLLYKLNELPRLCHRTANRVGISVCLLSPDGGGKSSVIAQSCELLDGSFHGKKVIYWRPGLLPPMGKLKFWNPSVEKFTNPTPHNHPHQHPVKSIVRFMYYYLDYVFGYLIKIMPLLIRKNLVFFDRYYYDYFVDLHRYRMSLPAWLPRLLLPSIPSPDIVIVLSVAPEIMMARKQELSFDELTRQFHAYRVIAKYLPGCHVIDASRPLSDVCSNVAEIVLTRKSELVSRAMRKH